MAGVATHLSKSILVLPECSQNSILVNLIMLYIQNSRSHFYNMLLSIRSMRNILTKLTEEPIHNSWCMFTLNIKSTHVCWMFRGNRTFWIIHISPAITSSKFDWVQEGRWTKSAISFMIFYLLDWSHCNIVGLFINYHHCFRGKELFCII